MRDDEFLELMEEATDIIAAAYPLHAPSDVKERWWADFRELLELRATVLDAENDADNVAND
jgi:hypothetical protein